MSIDLNTVRATFEPDAAVHAESEAEVPVALPVEDRPRWARSNTAGSRLAIAHDSHSRSPSLNLCAVDLEVLGEGASVTGRRGVEAQELLGGGVEQGVAFAAEQLALVGILRQPFQRVRGQRGGGVEAAADDQAEVAQDLHVGRGLAVDAQSQRAR